MNKIQNYFILTLFICFSFAQVFFSEYAEGSSNNKYLEIYNGTGNVLDLSTYAFPSTANAPDDPGEYEYWNTFDDGSSINPGDVFVICHGSADDFIQAQCDQHHTYLSNGDDADRIVLE
jgi:predicted extracellular nuclease